MKSVIFTVFFVLANLTSAEELSNPTSEDISQPIASIDSTSGNVSTEDVKEENTTVDVGETQSSEEIANVDLDHKLPTNETEDPQNINKTIKLPKVTCKSREILSNDSSAVRIVNSTTMLGIVIPETNLTANECALVLFYAPWCHFSAQAAPHYNALARLYPSFTLLAVNAIKYNSLNTRYGIVAVPTLLLFHNGRAVSKFNESDYSLDNYVTFVGKYTNTQPEGIINVTSADFYGPLPSEPIPEIDYVLWLAWSFILVCASFGFVKSSLCCRMVEIVRNNWREAEAQHEHGD